MYGLMLRACIFSSKAHCERGRGQLCCWARDGTGEGGSQLLLVQPPGVCAVVVWARGQAVRAVWTYCSTRFRFNMMRPATSITVNKVR